MPHVVLATHSPLFEVLETVEPFVTREGETVWRLRRIYLDLDERRALAECLIAFRGRVERFFVQASQREEDAAIVVRPHPVPPVETTPSLKRMVGLVAESLTRAHPDVSIAHTTIRDFLSDRYVYEPDPEPGGWDPLLPARGLPAPLDWEAIFGRPGPVEIEIGSGKGTFLVGAAEARPETNFVSIEWSHPYAENVRDRVRRRDLRNVRVVRTDAARFFADHVADGTVRAVHVYFPDPWPKERHHKRRLLQPPFTEALARALEPEGEVRFVTDHGEYFEAATAALEAAGLQAAPAVDDDGVDPTNYERKYRAEGRHIHRARYVRQRTTPSGRLRLS